jgi:arylsulfatase A-like enzyme
VGEELTPWNIKAAGELAGKGLTRWLDGRDRERPWFAFLNYMEAHAPYIPPRAFRERTLSPEQVDRSYEIDNSPPARWAYTFGLREYAASDLEILGGTYDATLLELDQLFRQLITDLEARGDLENTIVILASDHGEHLGEHHMLDHQYALYEQLLRVPLIVHYPPKIEPGRDRSPVETFDIFPTLLELAGLEPPRGLKSLAVSLVSPQTSRYRLAEYPAVFEPGIRTVSRMVPEWDAAPWLRRLRALYHDGKKFICATDGRHELYDLKQDPGESNDLGVSEAGVADELMQELLELAASLAPVESTAAAPPLTEEQENMLKALGYVGDSEPHEEGLEARLATIASCGFVD